MKLTTILANAIALTMAALPAAAASAQSTTTAQKSGSCGQLQVPKPRSKGRSGG